MTIKMKDKQIIERKLEIFLKEYEKSKDRVEGLKKESEESLKEKQIIERKLEIFLKEYEKSKDRVDRLEPIIETYAKRYYTLTGKHYVRNSLDSRGFYK